MAVAWWVVAALCTCVVAVLYCCCCCRRRDTFFVICVPPSTPCECRGEERRGHTLTRGQCLVSPAPAKCANQARLNSPSAKYCEGLYSTCASPVVPHLSTRHAHGCLASEIGRDPAFPTRYDRTEDSSRVTSPDRLAAATRPRSREREERITTESYGNIAVIIAGGPRSRLIISSHI